MLMRMEPSQQPVQPNYDFLANSGPQKQPGLSGGSTKTRILVVVVGALLLIIIGFVVMNLLSSAGKTAEQNLKSVIAEQEEIIRISDMGVDEALTTEVRSFAVSVLSVVRTDQQKIGKFVKLKPEERRAKRNTKTDEELNAAKASNRYDEALTETLTSKLKTYQSTLKAAYDSAKANGTRTALSDAYNNVSTLLAPQQSE